MAAKKVSAPKESTRKTSSRKANAYGPEAEQSVERAMHEMEQGDLTSGRSGKKVTSRKQAVAIGLSQARKAGAKVPRKAPRKASRKK